MTLRVVVADDGASLGQQAAADGGRGIAAAIDARGSANIIVATGASQLKTLDALMHDSRIDWSVVTGFHLDEYLDLPETHPASFRRYLRERFVEKVPLKQFHYVNGEATDAVAECGRLGDIISRHPIDVAFVGIGENGHLAFNDPPADFETEEPYLVVELDEACRKQQWGEGWFENLEAVPTRAISMSVKQILKARQIVCSVPDERKARAVAGTIDGDVTPTVPASVLQTHDQTTIYLDPPAASLLKSRP